MPEILSINSGLHQLFGWTSAFSRSLSQRRSTNSSVADVAGTAKSTRMSMSLSWRNSFRIDDP